MVKLAVDEIPLETKFSQLSTYILVIIAVCFIIIIIIIIVIIIIIIICVRKSDSQ